MLTDVKTEGNCTMGKKVIWSRLKYLLPALAYGIVYLIWFAYIEQTVTTKYALIHTSLDDIIPFIEIFVIPYFLWFPYIILCILYFCLTDTKDYIKLCSFLFIGMTVFLVVSTIFPNGQDLRPALFPRDNIFTRIIAGLYRMDTPTNIFPSIHVYNSIVVAIAIQKSEQLKKKKWISIGSLLLSTSIILSTMFIKQHSTFDVITAFLMALIIYPMVYVINYGSLLQTIQSKKRKPKASVS